MNENKPLVSIIVPVYNAERYLSEAIESVLNQTYTNFELILINDRSTDNSQEICGKYAEKDNRIVLLANNTENHGPGPTRNIGLDNATGEFIYFMDADDWIDKSLLQCAVGRMSETNADIVQFGVVYERDGIKDPMVYCYSGKALLTREEIKNDFSNFFNDNRMSLWLKFFRKKTIEGIRFDSIINGEDTAYVLDALCNAQTIAYIPKNMYHYRYVEGSTSHSWVETTIECQKVLWNHKRKYLESFENKMDMLSYATVAYDSYIWAIYQLSSNLCPLSYKERKRQLLSLNYEIQFEKYRKQCPLKWQHGISKIKYILVKYRLENLLLFFGPLFLRIVRGE